MTLQQMFEGQALVPGALRGYRTWRAEWGSLTSTGMTFTYGPPGTVEHATCRRFGLLPVEVPEAHGPSPSADCHCGFYAWYDPADTRIVQADTFGVVEATGRVVLGTHGFRAEHLRVVAVTSENTEQLGRLAAAGYTVYGSREALLADHRPDDVSGLVGHRCDHRCEAVMSMSLQGVVLHWAHVHASVASGLQQLGQLMSQASHHVSAFAADVAEHALSHETVKGVADPKWAAALLARRHRNTGPAPRTGVPPRHLPGGRP